LPEVYVAADTLTLLWFPAPILKKTITVDQTRIRVRDAGESSIIVQAVEDLRVGARHVIEVFFADGRAPARAAFVLVTDPSEVDTRIEVGRPELPTTACPAEVPRPRPEDFVLLDYVSKGGVQTAKIEPVEETAQGLSSDQGVAYRGNRWIVFDVVISNHSERPLWTPRDATLTEKGGVTVRARVVTVGRDTIAPGEFVRVLAVAEELPAGAGRVFTVEVFGDGGRSFVIPRVTLPKPVTEGKQ
jgi:uncharacterized protein (TIGR02268 family)